jgi:hypothetical protein
LNDDREKNEYSVQKKREKTSSRSSIKNNIAPFVFMRRGKKGVKLS